MASQSEAGDDDGLPGGDRWLTTRAASAYTGYSAGYLQDLAAKGEIDHAGGDGRALRFKRSVLDAWIERRTGRMNLDDHD